MSIIRVFSNSFVNPAHVGAVTVNVVMDEVAKKRITGTRIFDASGTNLMVLCETTVSTDRSIPDMNRAVKIDNVVHAEIIAAIKEGRDALNYMEIDAQLEKEGSYA